MKLSLNIPRTRLCGLLAPVFGLMLWCPAAAVCQIPSTVPHGGFTEGANGALYGVSTEGGQSGNGTIFRLNKDGGGFAILWSFLGTNGDGQSPGSALLLATNGVLYGTTYSGGYGKAGTLFKINQDGGGYAVLRSFVATNGDGAHPAGGLVQASNGVLYGTTSSGGSNNFGTVFSINPDGSGYSVLRGFAGGANDGGDPKGALLQGANGMLYGITMFGGSQNQGTVFKLNLDGSGYLVLKIFTGGSDGAQPRSGLAQGTDGLLYGTTYGGGAHSRGSVFRLSPDGTGYSILKSFAGIGGANPSASLVQGTNGLFYGTTTRGCRYGGKTDIQFDGTIFQMRPDGSGYRVIKNYQAGTEDGYRPSGTLLQASDGALYGTTEFDGMDRAGAGSGTAFRINQDGSGYTVIRSFTDRTGR